MSAKKKKIIGLTQYSYMCVYTFFFLANSRLFITPINIENVAFSWRKVEKLKRGFEQIKKDTDKRAREGEKSSAHIFLSLLLYVLIGLGELLNERFIQTLSSVSMYEGLNLSVFERGRESIKTSLPSTKRQGRWIDFNSIKSTSAAAAASLKLWRVTCQVLRFNSISPFGFSGFCCFLGFVVKR